MSNSFPMTGVPYELRTDRWRGYRQSETAQAPGLSLSHLGFASCYLKTRAGLREGLILAQRGHGIDASCVSRWYKTGLTLLCIGHARYRRIGRDNARAAKNRPPPSEAQGKQPAKQTPILLPKPSAERMGARVIGCRGLIFYAAMNSVVPPRFTSRSAPLPFALRMACSNSATLWIGW